MSYWADCGKLVVASPAPPAVIAAMVGKVRMRQVYQALARAPIVLGFKPGVDTAEALPLAYPQGRPTVMTIIDVDAIRERLRPLEKQAGPEAELGADKR